MGAIQQSINNVLGTTALAAGLINHTMEASTEKALAGVEQKIEKIPQEIEKQKTANAENIANKQKKIDEINAKQSQSFGSASEGELTDKGFQSYDSMRKKANKQLEKAKAASKSALDAIEARKSQLESLKKRLSASKPSSIIEKIKVNQEAKKYVEGGKQ